MARKQLTIASVVLAMSFSHAASAQLCPQNFDGVSAPSLPTGWSSSVAGAGTGWQTTTTNADSAPNAVSAGEPTAVGDSFLMSPPTLIDETNSTITFRHAYSTENTFDGGVLEISLGGSFQDIVAAGGSLTVNGYNGTISTSQMSPIAGRPAWTGDSGGYVSTVVRLPASAVGALATLRWRMSSDQSVNAAGWSVDSIVCGAAASASINGWMYGPSYPISILDEATTVMDGTLYTFGGVSTTFIANAYKFDGEQWTAIASLPEALEYPAAVNDGTHIYIIGGAKSDGSASNATYRYTPSTDTYEPMASFTTAAWVVAAAIVDGKIVKFGGNLGNAAGPTAATEIYDIAGDSWSPGADYPFPLAFISAFTHAGSVYGAGGIGAESVSRANSYRYDLGSNTWDDAAIANLPDVRWGSATIETSDGVIMAGGYVGGSAATNLSTSSVAWNAASNTWTPFDPLAAARARMSGAMFMGRPYVIGGRTPVGGFAGTIDVQIHDRLFADGFDGDE